ncbi:hypothetical protein F3Y22_tig00009023pilonHSYRG00089 [Hibiscus syriacus]|uniref:Uncharacterized protein n=1 Tax=Hibiscus syriacus TaxID=106335 RepID=A0A6A3C7B3_HIBSY|nr:hypothetical protein F3Y22_tig00009023pilonHSYRG00089 [Hibiscus syriacus]
MLTSVLHKVKNTTNLQPDFQKSAVAPPRAASPSLFRCSSVFTGFDGCCAEGTGLVEWVETYVKRDMRLWDLSLKERTVPWSKGAVRSKQLVQGGERNGFWKNNSIFGSYSSSLQGYSPRIESSHGTFDQVRWCPIHLNIFKMIGDDSNPFSQVEAQFWDHPKDNRDSLATLLGQGKDEKKVTDLESPFKENKNKMIIPLMEDFNGVSVREQVHQRTKPEMQSFDTSGNKYKKQLVTCTV